jgi:hypothetical protein
MTIKILSTSRDLVGDLLSVRAEILEHRPGYAWTCRGLVPLL